MDCIWLLLKYQLIVETAALQVNLIPRPYPDLRGSGYETKLHSAF